MKLLLLIFLICTVGFLLFTIQTISSVSGTQRVVLTREGFVPSRLTVRTGTTVVFSTSGSEPFWPASDTHPNHTKYPDFDSKKPIAPSDTWRFTFVSEGQWRFHDHINPNFSGEITVISNANGVALVVQRIIRILTQLLGPEYRLSQLRASCDKTFADDFEMFDCWEEVLTTVAREMSINTALDELDRLSASNIRIASDCHVLVHAIGEEAYWKYRGQPRFDISKNTGSCTMGFYHGYMQEYASHNTNINDAKEFCAYISKHTKHEGYLAHSELYGDSCIHGIGHGLTYRYIVENWGDAEAVVEKSMEHCRTTFADDFTECANGVYGGISAIYFGLHGYKIDVDESNPFSLCDRRPESELVMCYNNLIPPVYGILDMDVARVGALISEIPHRQSALVAMHHLGSMPSHRLIPKTDDYSSIIDDCRLFDDELHLACLKGFAGAIMYIGSYEEALSRTIAFCEGSKLSKIERSYCYAGLFETVTYNFSKDQIAIACASVPSDQTTQCR